MGEKTLIIKKDTLWKAAAVLFAVLFIISLFTGGFGIGGKAVSDTGGTVDGPKALEGSTFSVTGDPVCKDADGKPYVILFSTTTCPHCIWIKDTFDLLASEDFADKINLQHWELDTGDNTLTPKTETEVPEEMWTLFRTYSNGGVPTFVFGCSYMRLGNGYERTQDLNAEMEDFRFVINKLLE